MAFESREVSEVAAYYLPLCLPVRRGRLMSVYLIKSVDLSLWRWKAERSSEEAACYLPLCLPVRGCRLMSVCLIKSVDLTL